MTSFGTRPKSMSASHCNFHADQDVIDDILRRLQPGTLINTKLVCDARRFIQGLLIVRVTVGGWMLILPGAHP